MQTESVGTRGKKKNPQTEISKKGIIMTISLGCGCSLFTYSSLSFSHFFITLLSIHPLISSPQVIYHQSPGPQVKLDPPTAQAWSPPLVPVYPLLPPLAVPGSSCGVYLGYVWRKDPLNIPLSANKVTSDLLKLAMKEMHFYKSTVSLCLPPSLSHLPCLVLSDPPSCGAHNVGHTYTHSFRLPVWQDH